MIQLQLHEMFIIYTGLCLAIIFLAAWAHQRVRTWRERAALKDVLKCRICAFHFRDESTTVHPRCPHCGALVERKRLTRL